MRPQSASLLLGLAALACCASALPYEQSGSPLNEHEGYPAYRPTKPFETGYTVACFGQDKVCVPKEFCASGYVDEQDAEQVGESRREKCEINREVCCSIRRQIPDDSKVVEVEQPVSEPNNAYLPSLDGSPTGNQPNFLIPQKPEPDHERRMDLGPQVGCAAALLCVEEQYCDLTGTISKTPIALTPEQVLRRIPMVSCANPENGIIGKCCRDPNYVDPWPTGNLPADYNGGFDEQGFPKFLNISRLNIKPVVPIQSVSFGSQPQQPGRQTRPFPDNVGILPPRPFAQPNRIPNEESRPFIGVRPNQPQVPIQAQSFPRPSFNSQAPVRPVNGGINVPNFSAPQQNVRPSQEAQSFPRPLGEINVFEPQPSTNVRDFINPHQPGARCGLVNQGADCQ